MNNKMKTWIDNATYEELLSKWRFATIGDPFFAGEIGDYYAKVMKEKRENHVEVSKKIGWEAEEI